MPTYDYECPDGHRFEIFQRISDDPVAECPECGADAKRLISGGAGFLFKGEGFYITDYRSEEYKKKASAEEPGKKSASAASPASDSAAGGDSGGGAKPASSGDSGSSPKPDSTSASSDG